ncbi:MAG: hypothetical protein JWR45_2848, partial [Blastococcus sp.]|nr:hypothetical protein [Blastococcus sp.]
ADPAEAAAAGLAPHGNGRAGGQVAAPSTGGIRTDGDPGTVTGLAPAGTPPSAGDEVRLSVATAPPAAPAAGAQGDGATRRPPPAEARKGPRCR